MYCGKDHNLGRRNFSRLPVRGDVTLYCDGFIWRGSLINLSAGGMFIMSQRVLQEGAQVKIKFSLGEKQKTITCKAEVSWQRDPQSKKSESYFPQGMGLQFTLLSSRLRRYFDQFVSTSRSLSGLDTRIGGEAQLVRS